MYRKSRSSVFRRTLYLRAKSCVRRIHGCKFDVTSLAIDTMVLNSSHCTARRFITIRRVTVNLVTTPLSSMISSEDAASKDTISGWETTRYESNTTLNKGPIDPSRNQDILVRGFTELDRC